MKEFKNNDKARILATARQLHNMFYSKREKLENKLKVIVSTFDKDTKLKEYQEKLRKQFEEYNTKLDEQLKAKTEALQEKIQQNREDAKGWVPRAIEDMLDGHDIESLVTFSYNTSDTGKRSLVATFKYPTVLPPVDEDESAALGTAAEEEPEYDSAGFSTEDGLQEGEPVELAEVVAQQEAAVAMQDCSEEPATDERMQADIDEDMPGHWEPLPEAANGVDFDPIQEVEELVAEGHKLVEKYAEPVADPVEQFAQQTAEDFKDAVDDVVNRMPEPGTPFDDEIDELWPSDSVEEETNEEEQEENPFGMF